jgi:undecaprenyl diphosphate synthase
VSKPSFLQINPDNPIPHSIISGEKKLPVVQQHSFEHPMPVHVAIIMDGNGRWAQRHGKSRMAGHRKGVENVRRIVKASRNLGIQHITLYAFSVENWRRPKSEISALMSLLNLYLKKELEELLQNGVRLNVIGRIGDLPKNVQKTLFDTIEKTKANTQQILTLALNYGARTEIVDAVRTYTSLVEAGNVDPDLIIRTSGEHRLSNFLLLQAAYAEIYFTPLCWPEFLPEHLIEAIQDYHGRERRYGQTGEQLERVKESTPQA